MRVGIIGGGVAGVSMAIFLSNKMSSTILSIFKKGGLAGSFFYKGFTMMLEHT